MMTQLKKEIKQNPRILSAYGALNKQLVISELAKYNFKFPTELVQFWIEYGGGDFFQTETILSPIHSDNEFIYDIIEINDFLHQKGLNENYIVFNESGAEVTAFEKHTHEVAIISNKDYKIKKLFNNISQWFEYLCINE